MPVELKSPLSKFCALMLNLTILLLELVIHLLNLTILLLELVVHLLNLTILLLELAVHLLNLNILLLKLGILSHLQSVYMECNYTFKVFEGASQFIT